MTYPRGWRRWLVHLLAGTMAVLGLLVLTPALTADALCNGRSWFGGTHYCPAVTERVASTAYGVGRRVWLDKADVTYVDDDSVVFAWPRGCGPYETFCDSFVFLNVPWEGKHRPQLGIQVRLYGTTTAETLVPAGYVRTGDCFYVQICAD